jgi:sigma54-dependent transcription regulator
MSTKIIDEVIGADRGDRLDRFEKVQLADVFNVCRESKNLLMSLN